MIKAVETFATFMCSLIQGTGIDSTELKRTLRGVVQVVFGAVYFDWKLLEKGAVEMLPAFAFILDIFKLFARIKNFKSKIFIKI